MIACYPHNSKTSCFMPGKKGRNIKHKRAKLKRLLVRGLTVSGRTSALALYCITKERVRNEGCVISNIYKYERIASCPHKYTGRVRPIDFSMGQNKN